MSTPRFFGYGSLVNRATHDYPSTAPATITGWRRIWRHVEGRKVAFLTVSPCKETKIQGLIAEVPNGDWSSLDQREHNYNRVPATGVSHQLTAASDIHIYYAPLERHRPATTAHPILLSYVDVVVQGYLREFGEDGVAQFFASTDGWDAPVLDDRDDPIYPRHQRLTSYETDLADQHLKALGTQLTRIRF